MLSIKSAGKYRYKNNDEYKYNGPASYASHCSSDVQIPRFSGCSQGSRMVSRLIQSLHLIVYDTLEVQHTTHAGTYRSTHTSEGP